MSIPGRNYYAIIGVATTASADEIHRAYRKLARRYHPDLNPGNSSAEESFRTVQEAYEVLRHHGRRKIYDQANESRQNESARSAGKTAEAANPRRAPDPAHFHPAGGAASRPVRDFGSFDDAPHEVRGARKPSRRRAGRSTLADFVVCLVAVASVSAVLAFSVIGDTPSWWFVAIPTALFAGGFLLSEEIMRLMIVGGLILAARFVPYFWIDEQHVRSYRSYLQSNNFKRLHPEIGVEMIIIPTASGVLLRRRADRRKSGLPL